MQFKTVAALGGLGLLTLFGMKACGEALWDEGKELISDSEPSVGFGQRVGENLSKDVVGVVNGFIKGGCEEAGGACDGLVEGAQQLKDAASQHIGRDCADVLSYHPNDHIIGVSNAPTSDDFKRCIPD